MSSKLYKFIIFSILVLLGACGADTSQLIQKKWKLNAKVFVEKVEKKLNTKLEAEEKTAYITFANSLYADFQPDGVIETNLGGRLEKGNWKLNDAQNQLTLTRKEGQETLTIIRISNNKLILEHTDKTIKDNWVLIPSE